MNLFLSTRRLTSAKEDHLSEFIAAVLQADAAFQEAYASLVLGKFAAEKGWQTPEITEVSTQKYFPGTDCRPDLVLGLRDGHSIACEHKIDSPETPGQVDEEGNSLLQLARYLQLPSIDGVAYFRSSWSPPANEVLVNPKYVKPASREHFLWSDLYLALQAGSTDLARWLAEGFATLRYTPPLPMVGDLASPDLEVQSENRQNFALLWQKTRSALRTAGWRVTAGSICELYLQDNHHSMAEMIYISPLRDGGRVLLVRLTPRESASVEAIKDRLYLSITTLGLPVEVTTPSITRTTGHREVVDAEISLTSLLTGCSTTEQLEHRLWSYVLPLVDAGMG